MCFLKLKVSKIKPRGTIDEHLAASILLDKLEEMNCKAEIYLPDAKMKVYNKEDVKKFLSLDEIDRILYVAEEMDCDDFAAELFSKFAGIVWTNTHAFNWFISENEELFFVEPQNDKISQTLESWDIRFFLGR